MGLDVNVYLYIVNNTDDSEVLFVRELAHYLPYPIRTLFTNDSDLPLVCSEQLLSTRCIEALECDSSVRARGWYTFGVTPALLFYRIYNKFLELNGLVADETNDLKLLDVQEVTKQHYVVVVGDQPGWKAKIEDYMLRMSSEVLEELTQP